MLGGCITAAREEETPEPQDVDAGEDAVIASVHYGRAEAASHAYHQPDAPVVMPLELEDAPLSPPPRAAMSAPREPKEKRIKQEQNRNPEVEVAEEDGAVVYSYELTAKPQARSKSAERPAARRSGKPERDPVAESFLHTYGGTDSYQLRSSGTRY